MLAVAMQEAAPVWGGFWLPQSILPSTVFDSATCERC